MKWIAAAFALLLLAAAAPAIGSFHERLGEVPDRIFLLTMQGTSFNGLHAPDAPLLEAALGERVRFVIVASEAHTFHLHGHPWLLADGRIVDTFLVDVDTPHAFDVPAGGVARSAGDWMYHCHIDSHLAGGMWGIFRVYPYSVEISIPGGAPVVTLEEMGEPVLGATLAVAVDGANVPAHVAELGEGRYAIHAALPSSGELVVTADHALGTSVGRASLDGTTLAPPTIQAEHHAHAS